MMLIEYNICLLFMFNFCLVNIVNVCIVMLDILNLLGGSKCKIYNMIR